MKRGLTAAPQTRINCYVIIWSQEQSSLARVTVVFFVVILFAFGFPNDNCHCVLPDVESDTHTPSPPFGECRSNRQAMCFSSSCPLQDTLDAIWFSIDCQGIHSHWQRKNISGRVFTTPHFVLLLIVHRYMWNGGVITQGRRVRGS